MNISYIAFALSGLRFFGEEVPHQQTQSILSLKYFLVESKLLPNLRGGKPEVQSMCPSNSLVDTIPSLT